MADAGAERLDSQPHPGQSTEASPVKPARRRRRRRHRSRGEKKDWMPLGALRPSQNLRSQQTGQVGYGDGFAGTRVHPAEAEDAYQSSGPQHTPPDSPDGGVSLVPRLQPHLSPHHAHQIEPALVPLPQDDPPSPISEPSASATTSEPPASPRSDDQSETAPETASDTAPPSPVDGGDVPEVIHKRKCRRGRRPGATCRLCNQSVLEAWRYISELESGKPLPRKTLHKLHQEHECPCAPPAIDGPATEPSKEVEVSVTEVPAEQSPNAVSPSESEMPATVPPVVDEPSEAESPPGTVSPSLASTHAVLHEGHSTGPSDVTPSAGSPTDASNVEDGSLNEPLEPSEPTGCMHCEHCKTQNQQHDHQQQQQQRPRRRRRRRRRPVGKVAEDEARDGPPGPQSGENISATPQFEPQGPREASQSAASLREAPRASSASSASRQQTPRALHHPTAAPHHPRKLLSNSLGGAAQPVPGEAPLPNMSSVSHMYPSVSASWSPGLPLSSSSPLPPLYRHLPTTPAWPQLPPALSLTGLYDPIWGPPTWTAPPGQEATQPVQLPVRGKADPRHTYDPIYDPY